MDTQRYIEALEKGDAPSAIVPLIVAEAIREERLRVDAAMAARTARRDAALSISKLCSAPF